MTLAPAAGVAVAVLCIQNVSPAPLSTHWWLRVWPAGTVRGVAASQSLATPQTQEPGWLVVSDTDGAPLAAPAAADVPTPAALANATSWIDWWKPAFAGVDVTWRPEIGPGATAFQISDVPARWLARRTSTHCRPPPLTVVVCRPAPLGPSEDTKARSRSFDLRVENAGVVAVPLPSWLTVPSTASVPSGGGGATLETLTVVTSDVFARPAASTVRAASQCSPSTTTVVSQANVYGAAVSVEVPIGVPSSRNWTA